MKTTVTIKDIAEQLNLSRNTVAKALNGKYVPEATRERVLNKAIELNYKSLSSKAPSEKKKKYRILLLACRPLNNIRFFSPIIRAIENECFENEYDLFQFTYNATMSTFEVLEEYIMGLNIDGIVAIESFDSNLIKRLLKLNKPMCFIDCCTNYSTLNALSFDIIETSNFIPIYEITKNIIQKYQLKHFTYVGDETHCLSFQERYYGMLCALNSLGIPHSREDDILKSDNFDYGSTEMLKTAITNLKHTTECFICGNDFIARSICKALEAFGRKVPEDCLVVGFDNVAEAIASYPKITSVGTDCTTVGVTAIKTLVHRIENPNITPIRYSVKSTIIYRQSTIKE
jgi:LacI family transcriptional regulator